MDRDDPAYRGQSDYTRALLRLYDPLVLGLAARFVWRCPTSRLVEGYRQHIRDRHLDVGPGHWLLHRAIRPSRRQPSDDPRPEPERPRSRLTAPAPAGRHDRRGRRPQAASGRRAVRLGCAAPGDPLPARAPVAKGRGGRQCRHRPGSERRALRRIGPRHRPDHRPGCRAGCLPPSTDGVPSTTSTDTEEGLREILAASFEHIELETVGSIAIFAATNPRSNGSD